MPILVNNIRIIIPIINNGGVPVHPAVIIKIVIFSSYSLQPGCRFPVCLVIVPGVLSILIPSGTDVACFVYTIKIFGLCNFVIDPSGTICKHITIWLEVILLSVYRLKTGSCLAALPVIIPIIIIILIPACI